MTVNVVSTGCAVLEVKLYSPCRTKVYRAIPLLFYTAPRRSFPLCRAKKLGAAADNADKWERKFRQRMRPSSSRGGNFILLTGRLHFSPPIAVLRRGITSLVVLVGSGACACVCSCRLRNISIFTVQIDQMETDRPNILQEISTTTLVGRADEKTNKVESWITVIPS